MLAWRALQDLARFTLAQGEILLFFNTLEIEFMPQIRIKFLTIPIYHVHLTCLETPQKRVQMIWANIHSVRDKSLHFSQNIFVRPS